MTKNIFGTAQRHRHPSANVAERSGRGIFILAYYPVPQGCGLGRDVLVWRRSRDVPTSRLGLISVSEQYVSVSAE